MVAAQAPARATWGGGMKVLRRLIYRDILSSVAFVTLGFLALLLYFDL